MRLVMRDGSVYSGCGGKEVTLSKALVLNPPGPTVVICVQIRNEVY